MSRTFEGDFEHLLKAIREWAEIGNPMPAKNANEKLSWLFQQTASSRILLPDGNNNARPSDVYRKPSTKPPRTRPKVANLNL